MTEPLPSLVARLADPAAPAPLDPAAARVLTAVAELDALAAEACLRVVGGDAAGARLGPVDVVVGFAWEHRAHALDAAAQLAPAHRERVAGWLAAHPEARHLGFKVGGRPGDLQIYVRGEFEPAAIAAGFAGAGVACVPASIKNGLRLFDQHRALMLALELDPDGAAGTVYGGVQRNRLTAPAIRDAFGFLAASLVPARIGAWEPIAPTLLDVPGEELLYVSFAPVVPAAAGGAGAAAGGSVKLDAGERPLGAARRVLEAAGLAGAWPAVLEQIERHQIQRWSHLGVRLSDRGIAVVLYWSLATRGPV